MRIISTRRQFIADHSSTSYYFYAAKLLDKEARAQVNTLSSHVDVGPRTAELTYHGDFADLDDRRRKKFLTYYDVEVRESYDWWSLSVMLDPEKISKIDMGKFDAEGEANLTVEKQGKRICLSFEGWQMDGGGAYDEFGEDFMEGLADLGLELRAELYAGKTAALDVMRAYCAENEILEKPKSPAAKKLAKILEVI